MWHACMYWLVVSVLNFHLKWINCCCWHVLTSMHFFKSVKFMTMPVRRSIWTHTHRLKVKSVIFFLCVCDQLSYKHHLECTHLSAHRYLHCGQWEEWKRITRPWNFTLYVMCYMIGVNERAWLAFVVVSVTVGIVAFSIHSLVLFVTQVNAATKLKWH